MPVEIARMENLKSSAPVYKAIQYFSDRIKAGELRLYSSTEKERAEAKSRLEAKRAKDREYRSRNIEAERAKDRDRYARKKTLTEKRKSHY